MPPSSLPLAEGKVFSNRDAEGEQQPPSEAEIWGWGLASRSTPVKLCFQCWAAQEDLVKWLVVKLHLCAPDL